MPNFDDKKSLTVIKVCKTYNDMGTAVHNKIELFKHSCIALQKSHCYNKIALFLPKLHCFYQNCIVITKLHCLNKLHCFTKIELF